MKSREQLKKTLEQFGEIRSGEPMKTHTTFGIGGPAEIFLTVRTSHNLAEAIRITSEANADLFILGSGSNIVVGDKGIAGVVIDNRAKKLKQVDKFRFQIESGANFSGTARRMCRC